MSEHITIGMDLGDRHHIIVVIDNKGNEVASERIANNKLALRKYFQRYRAATVAIEAGTHSPWISRELEQLGKRSPWLLTTQRIWLMSLVRVCTSMSLALISSRSL